MKQLNQQQRKQVSGGHCDVYSHVVKAERKTEKGGDAPEYGVLTIPPRTKRN